MKEDSEQTLEGIKLEYTALRSEIVQRIGLRQQLISITLTIAGVMLGFGINNGSIALVYPPLAAFLAIAWTQNDNRVRDAATYIRDHLEPKVPGLGWENHVQEERKRTLNKKWRRTILSHGGIFLSTQLIAILVGILVLQFRFSPLEWALLVVDLIAVFFVLRTLSDARR